MARQHQPDEDPGDPPEAGSGVEDGLQPKACAEVCQTCGHIELVYQQNNPDGSDCPDNEMIDEELFTAQDLLDRIDEIEHEYLHGSKAIAGFLEPSELVQKVLDDIRDDIKEAQK